MAAIPSKSFASGLILPVYGMGTSEMGGRLVRNPDNDDAADIQALRTALDMGVTHFDSAQLYGGGSTEVMLGQAIEGVDRTSLFLSSKVYKGHQRPDDLRDAVETTCNKLNTDYLDLYMLHVYDPDVPLNETMDALCELADEGRVRFIGVSNFSVDRMQEAQAASRHKIAANQVHYNVHIREMEQAGVLAFCQAHDIAVIAWGPVQRGGIKTDAPVLTELAEKYEKSPMQMALNWLVSQPCVVVVSRTRSVDHLRENLGAVDWVMDPSDVERIRTEMPEQLGRSNRFALDYP